MPCSNLSITDCVNNIGIQDVENVLPVFLTNVFIQTKFAETKYELHCICLHCMIVQNNITEIVNHAKLTFSGTT